MRTPPDANSQAAPIPGRTPLSASGRARLAALQRFAEQRQPVVPEIHIGLVEKGGRRAEAAARHDLIGIGLELVLDGLLADLAPEFFGIRPEAPADLGQHP